MSLKLRPSGERIISLMMMKFSCPRKCRNSFSSRRSLQHQPCVTQTRHIQPFPARSSPIPFSILHVFQGIFDFLDRYPLPRHGILRCHNIAEGAFAQPAQPPSELPTNNSAGRTLVSPFKNLIARRHVCGCNVCQSLSNALSVSQENTHTAQQLSQSRHFAACWGSLNSCRCWANRMGSCVIGQCEMKRADSSQVKNGSSAL